MHAKPTGLADPTARASGLRWRRDGAGRRKASLRRIAATLALTAGVAVVPLLAGAASGASAASAGITISTAAGPFGTMLVVGSGKDDGYALYFISSDQPPHYGCATTKLKVVGHPYQCTGPSNDQNVDWPALTTKGAPVAGPGVSQKLLGTVQRAGVGSQVTYAGHPLYLFDQGPDAVTGEGWDEPGIPPDHGLWYPISAQGLPLPWADLLTTTPVDGKTVLGATMLNGAWHVFSLYSLSSDTATSSTCNGACAVTWPPLLTSGTPGLSNGLKASDFGTLKRSDGTLQVTYRGKPLYLYSGESAAPNANGLGFHVLGNGNGLKSPGGGTFNLVTP
jgi:predicted lipoprotein with Yx(FWY)xxD motif